jgi:hypothetical protein
MSVKVVTVVKNDLKGLMRTKDSIITQSVKVDWDIITPEDKSPTFGYAADLKKSGLVQNLLRDNGSGIYAAMNMAIQQSHSEDWLWFINAGDTFVDQNSYFKVLSFVQNTKNKWLYGGFFLGSQIGNVLGERHAPNEFKISNQLFARGYVSHQSTIFKVQFLQELNGFRADLEIAADWDLMCRASKLDPGHRLPESLSVFYLGGLSTLSRKLGNAELLQLRKEYMPGRNQVYSYAWFYYREIRNALLVKFEKRLPIALNFFRSTRLVLKTFLRKFKV